MTYIRSVNWVRDQLDSIRLVDCRFYLQNPDKGRLEYEEGHIPGAVYIDLEKDMSGTVGQTGGRHPLPNMKDFLGVIQESGIQNNDIIVAYDNQNGAMASRFVWMMMYMGHKEVYILDGGFRAWEEKGSGLTTEFPVHKRSSYKAVYQSSMIADQTYVAQQIDNHHTIILDSRNYERFAGITEPIDRKAGHIPSAVNAEWTKVLNEAGIWKSKEELRSHFLQYGNPEEWIVYCGSGVTAAPNVLALYEAGFKQVRLYVGSWSDWITNDKNPIDSSVSS
ncbi:3-mercaptopyruvate sulfurtransferase [Pontibacillus chungwhensis BH030062]|uniref:3-mercaptopyruvate sulfurtransferase n=1 Tax=Pontibacillus chungwhensis BH030062 TaxID=1385513 RepID=A0A0A2V2N8_9BACI|nr:sulfurtransferase [Pontibacillus chungwhensis]KGP93081.1 3-mercaptopyruvate sulfurtransferase [Pontibacillus chungwhensis BH030062]